MALLVTQDTRASLFVLGKVCSCDHLSILVHQSRASSTPVVLVLLELGITSRLVLLGVILVLFLLLLLGLLVVLALVPHEPGWRQTVESVLGVPPQPLQVTPGFEGFRVIKDLCLQLISEPLEEVVAECFLIGLNLKISYQCLKLVFVAVEVSPIHSELLQVRPQNERVPGPFERTFCHEVCKLVPGNLFHPHSFLFDPIREVGTCLSLQLGPGEPNSMAGWGV